MGARHSKGASWGNRHVASSCRGGCPGNAIGYTQEGDCAIFKSKRSLFLESLNPRLAAHGITEEDWDRVIEELRDAWASNRFFIKFKLMKKIKELNVTFFHRHECHAVYAEYGPKGGQAAMTIYSMEAWKRLSE